MKVSDFLVDTLIKFNVSSVFGIPGGVILDFLYSIEAKKPQIIPRLSFHEQGATFAASGYAQISGELGVAYATRGPGITNTITAIADAYYDSIPLLVITAHSYNGIKSNRRIDENQELDSRLMLDHITKYTARIESIQDAIIEIEKACNIALAGRKGPVLLDFNKSVLKENINFDLNNKLNISPVISLENLNAFKIIQQALNQSKKTFNINWGWNSPI
jgi:acetolactate synthase-1/2/3 large subunit